MLEMIIMVVSIGVFFYLVPLGGLQEVFSRFEVPNPKEAYSMVKRGYEAILTEVILDPGLSNEEKTEKVKTINNDWEDNEEDLKKEDSVAYKKFKRGFIVGVLTYRLKYLLFIIAYTGLLLTPFVIRAIGYHTISIWAFAIVGIIYCIYNTKVIQLNYEFEYEMDLRIALSIIVSYLITQINLYVWVILVG